MLDLESILKYEISCAKRYSRYITLLMVSAVENGGRFNDLISGIKIRECDLQFEHDGGSVILLNETDVAGAMNVLERFQKSHSGDVDMRASVACFPLDSFSANELLSIAERRLEKARNISVKDAVITTG